MVVFLRLTNLSMVYSYKLESHDVAMYLTLYHMSATYSTVDACVWAPLWYNMLAWLSCAAIHM